jgi:hypothetical protein
MATIRRRIPSLFSPGNALSFVEVVATFLCKSIILCSNTDGSTLYIIGSPVGVNGLEINSTVRFV